MVYTWMCVSRQDVFVGMLWCEIRWAQWEWDCCFKRGIIIVTFCDDKNHTCSFLLPKDCTHFVAPFNSNYSRSHFVFVFESDFIDRNSKYWIMHVFKSVLSYVHWLLYWWWEKSNVNSLSPSKTQKYSLGQSAVVAHFSPVFFVNLVEKQGWVLWTHISNVHYAPLFWKICLSFVMSNNNNSLEDWNQLSKKKEDWKPAFKEKKMAWKRTCINMTDRFPRHINIYVHI